MIAVTGAAGLIGSAVVRELNRRGREDLVLVDRLGNDDRWMNLRSLRFIHYLERDEFLDRLEGRTTATPGPDVIIHLGANSSTTEKNASYLIENNYRYSQRLAEYALSHGVRLVYASSAATYGDGAQGFEDDEERVGDLRPLNMYGYSKQLFDMWVKHQRFPRYLLGLKYFNVFGPNEYHKGEMQSVVLKAFRQIQAEGRMQLFKSYRDDFKDGEQKRDFLYVEDAARMTVFFALDAPRVGGIYNCGSGVARTWLDLGHAIFNAMGREPKIDIVDMPEHLRSKYQYYTCAPIDKIRQAGFDAPITSLEDAVADYVKSYLLPGEVRA